MLLKSRTYSRFQRAATEAALGGWSELIGSGAWFLASSFTINGGRGGRRDLDGRGPDADCGEGKGRRILPRKVCKVEIDPIVSM